jgi:DNA modification methylase
MNHAAHIETLPIDALVPYARNARTHSPQQVAQIAASIREFGFTNPVLIDAAGGIVAGHGRVMAAKSLGVGSVPCLRVDWLTEAQRRAYVLADNQLALQAGWDDELLAGELRALQADGFDLALTGFDADDLTELLAEPGTKGKTSPDDTPPVQAEAITRPGDVWVLGRHRLMCGDSTDAGVMALLLGGGYADACWTDPPYNVAYGDKAEMLNNYDGKGHRNTSRILNDDMSDADFRKFLAGFYRAAHSVMRPGAAIYVAHAETERTNFTQQFLSAGFKLSGVVIWRKDSLVLGRSDYQWIHEPILYGWKEGGAHKFYGGRAQTTVNDLGSSGSPFVLRQDGKWQITIGEETMIIAGDAKVDWVEDSIMRELKPKRNDIHPTMKPVALIERMLKNSARPGQVVLDPFGGSGSTIIAAEQLGMSARLMELSQNYCDVIIRRWQQFTGNCATLEATGAAFPEDAA